MEYKHGLHEIKYQYGLHDTEINNVIRTDDGIILEFNEGVYLLDETGKETVLSKKCHLEIKINYFDKEKVYEHIEIILLRKKKIKEIEFNKFEDLIKTSNLSIYKDYYSPFADSFLIKGFIDKYGIEFVVTEIAELSFVFYN